MSRYTFEMSRLPGQTTGTDSGGHGGTKPLQGFVPLPLSRLSRDNVPVAVSRLKEEGKAKPAPSMRAQMPVVAGIVDELRLAFGVAVVDGAIAAGVKLAREHARIQATQGQAVADGWLARQRTPAGSFRAAEAGRTVGAMPC